MASSHYCLFDIGWELVLHDNIVVQVFLEVFSALIASMSIIHGKYLNLGPGIVGHLLWLSLGLNDIQNDGDSILVRFTHEADMGVRSE